MKFSKSVLGASLFAFILMATAPAAEADAQFEVKGCGMYDDNFSDASPANEEEAGVSLVMDDLNFQTTPGDVDLFVTDVTPGAVTPPTVDTSTTPPTVTPPTVGSPTITPPSFTAPSFNPGRPHSPVIRIDYLDTEQLRDAVGRLANDYAQDGDQDGGGYLHVSYSVYYSERYGVGTDDLPSTPLVPYWGPERGCAQDGERAAPLIPLFP